MSRLVVGAAMLSAVTLGLPGIARAAAPPGLGGEQLSTSLTISAPGSYPFSLPCGGSLGGSSPDFNFSGTAQGPYPGSFVESGTVVYATDGCYPPAVTSQVTAYTARFTIDATDGTVVSGTETLTGTPWETNDGGIGGGWIDIGPVSTTYSATITTPSGAVYTDQGTSQSTIDQSSSGVGGWWSATLNDGPFVSSATPVIPTPPTPPTSQTPVLSNMVATVDANGNVEISVASTPNVINDTLYEPPYHKVAPDDTPVDGSAEWTVTGLSPGVHTLYAQGFTVPPGQPGPSSKPVSVTFTVPTPRTSPPSPPPTSPIPTPVQPSPLPPGPVQSPVQATPVQPSGPPTAPNPTTTPPARKTLRPRLSAYLQWNFQAHQHFTRVVTLTARKLSKGTIINVSCKGRGCPYRHWGYVAVRRRALNLQPNFRRRRLHVGDRLSVTISHAGKSKRYTYIIRARKVELKRKLLSA